VTAGIVAAWSDRRSGDLRPGVRVRGRGDPRGDPGGDAALVGYAAAVVGDARPVWWANQVHGAEVRVVGAPAEGSGRVDADASVASSTGVALAVVTADCAPIALGSAEGVFAAVHAGWRGLVAGVVDTTASVMRAMGATSLTAVLGPCIHAECYEFAEPDLSSVEERFGPAVRSRTAAGRPALDLPAAVAAALTGVGARQVPGVDTCTACSDLHFSHRARADVARQAMVVWATETGR